MAFISRTMGRPRTASPVSWKQPKRYLWLIPAAIPVFVYASWLGAKFTGLGALWWAAPLVAFVVVPLVDQMIGPNGANAPEADLKWLESDPFYRWATYLYLPNQYLSLIFACWLWAGGGWIAMGIADKLGLMATVGIVGGLAINAAHELGHTREQCERKLSKIALAQTCYGHFFVEHNRGHHVRVATAEDPASARFGESVYAFVPRSVIGGLRSAWDLEATRLGRIGKSRWTPGNDVLGAWLLSVGLFTVLSVWFRPVVLPWLTGQAIIGFCLLEVVNYIEHYGLRRQKLPSGRYERVRPTHSWNSSTVITNVLLFHLQRHSDHHANPLRSYQVLRHVDEAPQLPSGYSAMLLLALLPPLWRRVMDPRVIDFYGGDVRLAALKPGAHSPVGDPAARSRA
ncbi:alkane 1-monooxygenase [Mycobacterium colombiense]|uniref:Alkane 1-monooxygenase n=1 Tax=Mycobacterium colombiense TaxID=339268 RepID=A0A853LV13_9MYCO|nr:alkane 1-monooxygenase [Mycobacterium colombiense]OBJ10624.1 alkane 1-monooxygenase [Mycobacterium colombiense]OBJ23553.1 alkane 1-monooxygenase [Mycobacterium colombiense]OBJ38053.1 alkane 1-monooxygenase [Mycobacterium colombiense]OBJ57792.1 alkane 1-monooxygenase [Mycobacterium colombiense]OBJ80277.1 alkane 1-monooxygenase [Mycobacterium colombiense]